MFKGQIDGHRVAFAVGQKQVAFYDVDLMGAFATWCDGGDDHAQALKTSKPAMLKAFEGTLTRTPGLERVTVQHKSFRHTPGAQPTKSFVFTRN